MVFEVISVQERVRRVSGVETLSKLFSGQEEVTVRSMMHSCVSRVEAVSKVFSMQERVTRVFRVKTVNKELTVQKSLVGHGSKEAS